MENTTSSCLFGRKGGAGIDLLNNLRSKKLQSLVKELVKLEDEVRLVKQNLLDDIYQAVQLAIHDDEKKIYIKFKRAIQKDQQPKATMLNDGADKELIYKVKLYYIIVGAYNRKVQEYKSLFYSDLYKSIDHLGVAANASFFQNGLLFSSQVLRKQILKSDFKFRDLNKKDRRLVNSTLKYLTRSVTKTTPFSSFNTIELFGQRDKEVSFSEFQLNNVFFYYLKKKLLSDSVFKNELCIKLNPSIKEDKHGYTYFINKENNESFKRIDKVAVLDFLKDQLSVELLTYNTLVNRLAKATESEVTTTVQFVDQLITEGYMILNYPVHQNNKNWLTELSSFIDKKGLKQHSEMYLQLVNILNESEAVITDLNSNYEIDFRQNRITLLYDSIKRFFTTYRFDQEFFKKVTPQDLFYEDRFEQSNAPLLSKQQEDLANILSDLNTKINSIPYKKELHKYLIGHLNIKRRTRISLLDFYEKYYLKYHPDFVLDPLMINEFNNKTAQLLESLNEENGDSFDIDKLFPQTDKVNDITAFGAYIQTINKQNEKYVLNGFTRGDYQIKARFLNGTDDATIKKIKTDLKAKYGDTKLIEIKDASLHNTNNFPPITDHALAVDFEDSCNNHYQSINISDIFVETDGTTLKLVNDKGNTIKFLNSSLEGLTRRSKFTQFLDLFDPFDNTGYSIFLENLRQYYRSKLIDEGQNVVVCPRIQFFNKIVIKRKTWYVKVAALAKLITANTQDMHDCYYHLYKWIKMNKLPSEAFIKISSRKQGKDYDDHYKPQYIDFTSPVCILLLKSLINKAADVIEIAEMLPHANDIKANQKYVQELLINVN